MYAVRMLSILVTKLWAGVYRPLSAPIWLYQRQPSFGLGADPGVQAVSPQVTISHPPGGRLPLLTARPAVTVPAAEHHHPLAGTKLYCLVTEAHRCEQLAQGCYAAFAPSLIGTHDLLIASPTLHLLRVLYLGKNFPAPLLGVVL